ncbi:Zinc finger protein 592 [Sciurus carolinensis]|uniref:Zinc finger protein 592 n=1 Tax=Sciurus carolinensis TaxID=30640 RepID=A0AA41T1M4_SCICA|nr:zinc finger protein 592 [Sciurus carolinensis]XP_047395628.1 zinc finger protein 592 [Sciurus carolinensis]XP_047395629.1 zinc finger protein 592 [Sciurus carolinensis]XP_047395631.1 zinc finger protein 592 [Sciurus carolinensis]MBZ3880049.1 Zinc finger protein 592 [Sciurus carolinensis]
MGDMKTPDFDDLLAAFDIPDPTSLDAKEAIQAPSEENESPLKPSGMCIDESVSLSHSGSAPDVPAVSVIVKNTSRQESFEAEKDHIAPSLLHNGFRGSDLPSDPHNCGKFDSTFMNGDSTRSFPGKLEPPKSEPLPTFNQFSPISSPEPEDPIKDNGFGIKPKHSDSYFPPTPGCGAVGGPVLEALAKFPVPELHMFDHFGKKEPKPEPLPLESHEEHERVRQKVVEPHEELNSSRFFGEALGFNSHPSNSIGEPKKLAPEFGTRSSVPPRQRLKPAHSKLSSCVAALVALQAKRVASVTKEDQPGHTKDPSGPTKEGSKGSPKMPKSPKSPRSPLEAARKSIKPSDSPRSICSDSSSKGSPSVAASSPPAIPKVRIKTIKTSSGEIKRTVTRILPDPDDPSKSPVGSPVGSAIAEPPSEVPGDEGTAVPVEEHFPEVGTNSGSPQRDKKEDESMTKSVDSTSPCCNSGSRVPKGAAPSSQMGKKQQSTALQASTLAPANLLPKAVHLANLNLVPHSVAASVTAKSSAQRRNQPQLTQMSVPLVHQVKKAAPLIVEVFNKVLHSSNPVPLYAPNLSPPADSRIHVPASGYCCLECGDAFALEKSLSQHYGRRSVHIEVLCTLCSKTLLFFNKCSLLRHARDHKSKGLVMQCSQLLVKPISADQMFVSAPANSVAPATLAPSSSPKHGPTLGSASPSPPPPAFPLYPDPVRLIRYGTKCPECHKQMRDYMVLAAHFQRTTEETEGLTCQVCQMLLPNQCSFCAHQRIHAHKSPYCCPECGVLCRSAYFQTHVKENCLHYARKVGYRCIHCGVVHLTLALLKSHIQERHCQVFHKCAFCPMAFKTASSTADHSATQHPTQPHRPSQLIYKCSCEMVFNKKRHIQQHFYQNVSKAQAGVFKCPECPLLFLQKPELMQHVKSTHGVPRNVDELSSLQSSADMSSSRPGSRVSTESPTTSVAGRGSSLPSGRWGRPEAHRRAEARPRLRNTGWTCQECQEWVPDRESYVSHMKKSHGRTLKRYPCRQCEQSFHTPNSLRKHIRNNHDTVKKVYTCGYCTEDSPSFPRPSLLESHISLMHGIRNPDLSQTSKVRHLGAHSPQVNHLKRPVSAAGDAPGTSNGATVSSTKRHKSLFQCAKCSFATDSGLEFQSHIPQHQVDSSTAQCLLCGLCYTSASSLSRHLFIVHKVRDQEEEEEEEEIVEVKVETAELEEGSGEEVAMETRENGLEEYAGEPLLADPGARRSLGLAPEEDSAQDAQSQPQASQDQDSHALSPQV